MRKMPQEHVKDTLKPWFSLVWVFTTGEVAHSLIYRLSLTGYAINVKPTDCLRRNLLESDAWAFEEFWRV